MLAKKRRLSTETESVATMADENGQQKEDCWSVFKG